MQFFGLASLLYYWFSIASFLDFFHIFTLSHLSLEIASVAEADLHDDLHSLDIDVYEQDRFEKGILNQVDSALTNAESNFKKTITRKQIAQLQDEKRWALGQCQKQFWGTSCLILLSFRGCDSRALSCLEFKAGSALRGTD